MIAGYGCVTGEGPLLHAADEQLYWLDIPNGRIFRSEPGTGQHEQVDDGPVVGGFTIQVDGSLLLFGERGTIRVWRDGDLTTLVEGIPEERGSRFNDVIADPEGRVFCGTMPDGDRPRRRYRLGRGGTPAIVLANAGLSNGMGLTPDLTGLYHTDSAKGTITRHDYGRATGEITNGRVVVRVPATAELPNGMAVNERGDLWSARWDGGALVHYAPDGAERGRIAFPARKVSSVTFGGSDYADAYVTTAGGGDKLREGPGAGALYRVRLGVRGRAPLHSRIG